MAWIKNTKKGKPEIDGKYTEEHRWSQEVLIHLKNGLTFIGYWDFNDNCWWSELTKIDDDNVMFWCKIPKLPCVLRKDSQN